MSRYEHSEFDPTYQKRNEVHFEHLWPTTQTWREARKSECRANWLGNDSTPFGAIVNALGKLFLFCID